jgi:5-methylcytosine-specific restriction endonuclease McrA
MSEKSLVLEGPALIRRRQYKNQWQKEQRRKFSSARGYSSSANYACGGNREAVLVRDGRKCVACGLSESGHIERYGRRITIDHKNKDRTNNLLENLQTLCLSCHARKDNKCPRRYDRNQIVGLLKEGISYSKISKNVGCSIGLISKIKKQAGLK